MSVFAEIECLPIYGKDEFAVGDYIRLKREIHP